MIFKKSVKTTYAYQTFSHSIPWISVFWKDDNNQCYLDINKNNNDMKKGLPEIYRYSVLLKICQNYLCLLDIFLSKIRSFSNQLFERCTKKLWKSAM